MSEFDLIRTYFSRVGAQRSDVALGVGDDCALLQVTAGSELAVSIDTLVSGVHFLPGCNPEGLGHKCLAVGLSDLAAMGAQPAWATLALTLPAVDPTWLEAFAVGFSTLACEHNLALVGGDTTRGPLSISVQVHGLVPVGNGLRRAGAGAGDLIFVSGTLGDAGLALRRIKAGEQVPSSLRMRLERPTPRVSLGTALSGLATAMIDISDGLAADLGHILTASDLAADLDLDDLPLSTEVAAQIAATGDWSLPLAAGDDYELCFTVPPGRVAEVRALAERLDCPLRTVGHTQPGSGLRCLTPDGTRWDLGQAGFDHFAAIQ